MQQAKNKTDCNLNYLLTEKVFINRINFLLEIFISLPTVMFRGSSLK